MRVVQIPLQFQKNVFKVDFGIKLLMDNKPLFFKNLPISVILIGGRIFYLSVGLVSSLFPFFALEFNVEFATVTDNPGIWHLMGDPGVFLIL